MPTLRTSKPRVLAVVPYSPNQVRIRTYRALEELACRAEVDLVCLEDGLPLELPPGIRSRIVIPNASGAARLLRVALGLLRGFPICHEFYNSSRLPGVLSEMDLGRYDAVYVEKLPLHRLHIDHPQVVYDCVDCMSHLSRLFASRLPGYKRLLYGIDALLAPRHERAACNAASVVLTPAQREVPRLRDLGVTKNIEVWFQRHFSSTLPRGIGTRERFIVSFQGKLSYPANVLALRALDGAIAPALDPLRFDLRVIGKCPSAFPRKFPRLKFSGFVKSMPEAIRESDLSVFPMTVSVGFSNKAMESLAAGVPFIGTRDVVEGLPPMPELLEHGVYVRKISEFAAEIERFSRLTLERRQAISRRCYEYVRGVYAAPSRNEVWERVLGANAVAELSRDPQGTFVQFPQPCDGTR